MLYLVGLICREIKLGSFGSVALLLGPFNAVLNFSEAEQLCQTLDLHKNHKFSPFPPKMPS